MPSTPSSKAPTVVRSRLDRLRRGGVAAAPVSAAGTAALRGAGFRPVGEVMGAVALRVAPSGFFSGPFAHRPTYPVNWQGGPDGAPPPVYTSGHVERVPSGVAAQRTGYRTALSRLRDEVTALGGDGAVDVRIEHAAIDDGIGEDYERWQFVASGTAVRSLGRVHAERPFTCALGADDFTRAVLSGWLPLQYLVCPVTAARWVEPASRRQARRSAPNGEIDARTEAVNVCRRQAAEDFATAARDAGADAAVMQSMTLRRGPSPDLAEVSVVITGTALARFRASRSSVTPTVVQLDDAHG